MIGMARPYRCEVVSGPGVRLVGAAVCERCCTASAVWSEEVMNADNLFRRYGYRFRMPLVFEHMRDCM